MQKYTLGLMEVEDSHGYLIIMAATTAAAAA